MIRLIYFENVVSLDLQPEKCIGCGMCLQVCPHGVFAMREKKVMLLDKDHCMECGACMRNCPTHALTVEAGEGCVRGIINELLGIEGPCC